MDLDSPSPTVGDLLKINQHLDIECSCGWRVRWNAVEACERLGVSMPFEGLTQRLKCSACGRPGRDGRLSARPCTLDLSAWWSRERGAGWNGGGSSELDAELATLQKLLGDRGELGGDGPVTWPPVAP